MTYTPNIPVSGQSLGVTRSPINSNFQVLNTTIAVDHIAMNSAGAGQHKQVTFNTVSAPATPVDPVSILYTKNDANTHPQLFFLNSQAIPYTAATNGSILLFAGIILKWGSVNAPSSSQPFTFSGSFPTACFQVIVSGDGAGNTDRSLYVKTSSVTQSGFTANSFGTYDVIRYIAIGN